MRRVLRRPNGLGVLHADAEVARRDHLAGALVNPRGHLVATRDPRGAASHSKWGQLHLDVFTHWNPRRRAESKARVADIGQFDRPAQERSVGIEADQPRPAPHRGA